MLKRKKELKKQPKKPKLLFRGRRNGMRLKRVRKCQKKFKRIERRGLYWKETENDES